MSTPEYSPLLEYKRGGIVESIHHGAIAVVDVQGNRLAHYGDGRAVTFMRSSAKPFQALPFLQAGGKEVFDLDDSAIALMCSSHQGTDEHVRALRKFQARVGVQESELMCGIHPPFHAPTLQEMHRRGEAPSANRHNCSGKHTGMLAFAVLNEWPKVTYLSNDHPVQERILDAVAALCDLPREAIGLGIDGCSAPNFAVPLFNTARAFARLSDPEALPEALAAACRRVTSAMRARPDMVGGPGAFDTRLMEVSGGRLVAKVGAEGYQGIGLMPGALGSSSPGIGIAIKIADGDARQAVIPAVALEVLRQLGALTSVELAELAEFGPQKPVCNWRQIEVGRSGPAFTLESTE